MNLLVNESIKMTSLDIAEVTKKQHKHVLADIRKEIEELGDEIGQLIFRPSSYINSQNKEQPCYEFGKDGAMQLALKYDAKTRYRVIKRIEELETLPQSTSSGTESFEKNLIGAKYSIDILRVDETSKIKMLEQVHERHNVPSDYLPVYVDEYVTKSLTSLIEENGIKISAQKANNKLMAAGFLELKQRPSSKGGTKEFKSITEKGSKYGKNLINPRNQRETQPHYYESSFMELMKLAGVI